VQAPGVPALRVGLTGGIGSGKSTVAAMLVEAGAALIDADAISRGVTASGGAAIAQIGAEFGAGMIDRNGAMDRDAMRALAFSNPHMRHRLEAIIHPLVARQILAQAEQAAQSGSLCLLFDIPLLVESGRWRPQLDRVLVVDCLEATQISRVLAREAGRAQWTREAVEKVIAGQATRTARLAAADAVIYNDGLGLDALRALAGQMASRFGL
jgi:dephospho-CoA kinase